MIASHRDPLARARHKQRIDWIGTYSKQREIFENVVIAINLSFVI